MNKNITKNIEKIIAQKDNLNIALLGEIGTGKTHFVQKFVQIYTPESINLVSSPTFTYQNIYKTSKNTIHHFDLYRIDNEQKLLEIALWESLENNKVITFIEWADIFSGVLTECTLCFRFFLKGSNYIIQDEST